MNETCTEWFEKSDTDIAIKFKTFFSDPTKCQKNVLKHSICLQQPPLPAKMFKIALALPVERISRWYMGTLPVELWPVTICSCFHAKAKPFIVQILHVCPSLWCSWLVNWLFRLKCPSQLHAQSQAPFVVGWTGQNRKWIGVLKQPCWFLLRHVVMGDNISTSDDDAYCSTVFTRMLSQRVENILQKGTRSGLLPSRHKTKTSTYIYNI